MRFIYDNRILCCIFNCFSIYAYFYISQWRGHSILPYLTFKVFIFFTGLPLSGGGAGGGNAVCKSCGRSRAARRGPSARLSDAPPAPQGPMPRHHGLRACALPLRRAARLHRPVYRPVGGDDFLHTGGLTLRHTKGS